MFLIWLGVTHGVGLTCGSSRSLLDQGLRCILPIVAGLSVGCSIRSVGGLRAWHGHVTSYLSLFALAMLLVVVSASASSTLTGWECLGFSSCALVGHYRSSTSTSSGFLALFCSLSAGCFITVMLVTESHVVASESEGPIGSVWTKCALPMVTAWLLAAMAGPVFVSSLLHSATLVVAGFVLAGKLAYLSSFCPDTVISLKLSALLSWSSCVLPYTLASYIDTKQLLAVSTCLQGLALVLILCNSGLPSPTSILATTSGCHSGIKSSTFLGAAFSLGGVARSQASFWGTCCCHISGGFASHGSWSLLGPHTIVHVGKAMGFRSV